MQFSKLILAAMVTLCCITDAHAQGADPIVVMQTTRGQIAIRVYRSMAPRTAWNFLDLVSRGFYNGLIFHRIENWCIQGGDPLGNGTGDFIDPQTGRARYVDLEVSPRLHHNAAGVVAMARPGNNINGNSCQFYILKAPMPGLDNQYSIFGGVVDGLNVVRSIGRGDRIISAQIVEGGGPAAQPQSSAPRRSGGTSASNAGTPTDSGF